MRGASSAALCYYSLAEMKEYYRIMLGRKSVHAGECLRGGFIGADFGIDGDLTAKLYENWRDFNHEFIPIYLDSHPDKNKITAGLACGALHTVCKGVQTGDIVLCPDGSGRYLVGEVAGDYLYRPGEVLPHRRAVSWLNVTIDRREMSESLRNSTGSIGTVSNISKYAEELERFIGGVRTPALIATDETVEDPSVFALEAHLEEFLVNKGSKLSLARTITSLRTRAI